MLWSEEKILSDHFELLDINNETTDFKVKCFDEIEKFYKEARIKERQLEFKRCIEIGITGTTISYY